MLRECAIAGSALAPTERHNFGAFAAQRRLDLPRDAVGNSPQRVSGQVRIPLCRRGVGVSEQLADNEKTVTADRADAGEPVA